MRLIIRAALGAVFAFAAMSAAQSPTPTPTARYEMPGSAVGRPSVQPVGSPVGTRLPDVGTKLGSAVGGYGPNSPFGGQWPTVDPNQVVAPYPQQPGPAADFWDKLAQRWAASFDPPKPPETKWIPGTTRRARERRERYEAAMERWHRD